MSATNVEGIFRLSGAEKRIRELVVIFNSPDRYGKGLDWDGYTVHDAANVLRRYLNQLPEPIVPLDLYQRFREPIRGHAREAVGDQEASQGSSEFNLDATIATYQQLITELPPLNRQLLLYILDLLAVFASKSDENRMTSQNLAAIFQPGMLSHPDHDMAPPEYRLSQNVLVFLIENQDHFLIGMTGTAADEKTVNEVQNGSTPPPATPTTKSVARSASNASAGADSLRRQGGVRRNVSVNSRHSRQSNNAPSPGSPAYGPAVTHASSGGVHRSNTVPSKKSPGLPSGRLQKSPAAGSTSPSTMLFQPTSPTHIAASAQNTSGGSSPHLNPTAIGTSSLTSASHAATAGQSQDRLLLDPTDKGDPETPTKDKTERALFLRSTTTDSEKRQPNKLKKKRIPGSTNPSAQSSQSSLHGPMVPSGAYPPPSGLQSVGTGIGDSTSVPARDRAPGFDGAIPGDSSGRLDPGGGPALLQPADSQHAHTSATTSGVVESKAVDSEEPSRVILPAGGSSAAVHPEAEGQITRNHDSPGKPGANDYTGRDTTFGATGRSDIDVQRASDTTLKPQESSNSLHSGGGGDESMNDASDLDHDPAAAAEQKEKRRRWRLSRKKDESLGANLTSPKKTIGANNGAETSTTSFGSGRPRHSFTGDTIPAGSESGMSHARQEISNDSGPSNGSNKDDNDKKGSTLGWLKSKIRSGKDEKRERDAEKERERSGKSLSPTSDPAHPIRGKSMDVQRSDTEKGEMSAPAAP